MNAGCDCPPADPAGCGLADLVRPRFYPGQVLTDRDLSDLQGWVEARLALARLRTGWGAVCGLGVTVDGDTVTVQSGYAVDAAGNDVVLTKSLTEKLPRWSDWKAGCGSLAKKAEGGRPPPPVTVGPFLIPVRDLAVYDVLLCHTAKAEAEAVIPGCRPLPRCEYTRQRDGGMVKLVPVPLDDAGQPIPPPLPSNSGLAAKLFTDFGSFAITLPATGGAAPLPNPPPNATDPSKWFTGAAKAAAAVTLPGLAKWLEGDASKAELRTPWGAARVLAWVVAALREPPRDCPEPRCGCPEAGVPLARFWAVRRAGGFDVKLVSAAPPHRRPAAPDLVGDPLAVRTHLGRSFAEVRLDLTAEGVLVDREAFEPPADPATLSAVFAAEETLSDRFTPGKQYAALVGVVDADAHPRVVAFREGTGRPSLVTGDAPLTVEVYKTDVAGTTPPAFADPPPGPSLSADAIPPGATIRLVIDTAGRLTAAVKRVAVFSGLTGQVHDVQPIGDATNKPIVFRVQVPPQVPGGWATVAVLVMGDADDPRLVARTGTIPKQVDGGALAGENVPKLTVGATPTADADRLLHNGRLVLLGGGTAPPLPHRLSVKLSNPSPGKATGKLEAAAVGSNVWAAKANIDQPTTGPVEVYGEQGVDLADSAAAVRYRVTGWQDEFLRSPPAAVTLEAEAKLERIVSPLSAKVTNTPDGGGEKSELKWTNGFPSECKVSAVTLTPAAGIPPAVIPFTLAAGEVKPVDLGTHNPPVTKWLFVVEYETGGVKEKAAGEFGVGP